MSSSSTPKTQSGVYGTSATVREESRVLSPIRAGTESCTKPPLVEKCDFTSENNLPSSLCIAYHLNDTNRVIKAIEQNIPSSLKFGNDKGEYRTIKVIGHEILSSEYTKQKDHAAEISKILSKETITDEDQNKIKSISTQYLQFKSFGDTRHTAEELKTFLENKSKEKRKNLIELRLKLAKPIEQGFDRLMGYMGNPQSPRNANGSTVLGSQGKIEENNFFSCEFADYYPSRQEIVMNFMEKR